MFKLQDKTGFIFFSCSLAFLMTFKTSFKQERSFSQNPSCFKMFKLTQSPEKLVKAFKAKTSFKEIKNLLFPSFFKSNSFATFLKKFASFSPCTKKTSTPSLTISFKRLVLYLASSSILLNLNTTFGFNLSNSAAFVSIPCAATSERTTFNVIFLFKKHFSPFSSISQTLQPQKNSNINKIKK